MKLNFLRVFAVVCVAVITAFIGYMSWLAVNILSSPGWCGKALQAEKISSQNFGGLTACTDLLKIQLVALAKNSYIFGGTLALCLLTLMVIVIAGGKVTWEVSETGMKSTMERDKDADSIT